jgi:hypothetical protein
MWRIEWTGVGKPGLSAWVLRPCMFACYLLQLALHNGCKMPLQIATASFTLLFAVLLMLTSNRFVDSRAPNLNPALATRNAVMQVSAPP